MGVVITNSTIPGSITPMCNDCGIALCWDVENSEYEEYKEFWDNWTCRDCNPNYSGAYERFKNKKTEIKTKMEEKITGTVERIIYSNSDSAYYVLSVLRKDNEKICTITANHLKIVEGISYEFVGKWISNSKFGTQFKAENIIEIPPSNNEAMIKYLSSSFFKGVGPVLASKIVKHFKGNAYDVLKTDIEKLIEVPGISKKKLEVIKKSWAENTEINEIMLFLTSYDISTLFSSRIYEFFGRDCVSKIRINPYSLTQIDGIGFKYADKVALDIGFSKDCKERISAGIKYVLNESENGEGHCFLYHNQILERGIKILGVAIEDKIDEVLFKLIDNNEIKLSKINNEERYYSNEIFYAERSVVNKIDILKDAMLNLEDHIIEEYLSGEIVNLSDEQKKSVLGILKNGGVSILTGSAGTGKTTVLKSIFDLLTKFKIDFAACCPTGKSAMRVIESTGYNATTIHRLLGYDHFNKCFLHNEKNQLCVGFLIVDESSMINIELMNSLLKALPQDCCVLFSGDYQQLSPIGSGNPFKDLIIGKCVNVFRLTKTFRQSNGKISEIISSANKILKGEEPIIDSPLENPKLWTEDKVDCLFIESGDFEEKKSFSEYPEWNSLRYGCDFLEMIKRLYLEIIPKYYPGKKIQIISPMNKGYCGCDNINLTIREIVNPSSKEKNELDLKFRNFREDDVVIQCINNYDIGTVNGEIGIIKKINLEEKSALIEFEYENKVVEYKRSDLLQLKLAYAVSCHKYQGSECDIVIAVLSMAHYPLLYRSMLYTLITRGKNLVTFVGERKALKIATNNIKDNQRQTSLIELIKLKTISENCF